MQLKGTVKEISKTITISDSFKKRELVIETPEKYPQKVKFDFLNKSTDILSALSSGEEVDVHFNIRGSEYNGKYYVNLTGWKIEKVGSASPTSEARPIPKTKQVTAPAKKAEVKVEEELADAEASGSKKTSDEEEDLTF